MLVFKTRVSGISFQAEWVSRNRRSRVPALGPEAHANGNGVNGAHSHAMNGAANGLSSRRTLTLDGRPWARGPAAWQRLLNHQPPDPLAEVVEEVQAIRPQR